MGIDVLLWGDRRIQYRSVDAHGGHPRRWRSRRRARAHAGGARCRLARLLVDDGARRRGGQGARHPADRADRSVRHGRRRLRRSSTVSPAPTHRRDGRSVRQASGPATSRCSWSRGWRSSRRLRRSSLPGRDHGADDAAVGELKLPATRLIGSRRLRRRPRPVRSWRRRRGRRRWMSRCPCWACRQHWVLAWDQACRRRSPVTAMPAHAAARVEQMHGCRWPPGPYALASAAAAVVRAAVTSARRRFCCFTATPLGGIARWSSRRRSRSGRMASPASRCRN